MRPCLQESELSQVLAGSASPEDLRRWVKHLDDCASCQANLERLADPHTSDLRLHSTVQPLSADTLESLYRLGDSAPVSRSAQDSTTPQDSCSQFLTPSDDQQSIGRFGDYEVLSVLGRGGMGLVLKAVEPVLERVVAIKILAPQAALSETGMKRFLAEARAAAQIEHPHVVGIHQVAQLQGTPYIVMPCIAGESLAEQLAKSGKLDPERAIEIAVQVCEALEAAHHKGIVHRDIKPANLLIEQATGCVKVSDFGLARAVDDPSLTRTGFVAGTPQFMSPEQARGESVDQRSDLFSLGAVLFTMLVGKPPFDAEQALSVVHQVVHETPPPVSVAVAAEAQAEAFVIPRWLDRVVAWAMAKDPAARPPDAAALRTALRLQSDASIPSAASVAPAAPRGADAEAAAPATPLFGNARQLGALFAFATLLIGLWYGNQWLGGPTNRTGTSPEASAAVLVQDSQGTVSGYGRLEEALTQTTSGATITIRRGGIHQLPSSLFEQLEHGAEIEIRNGIVARDGQSDAGNAAVLQYVAEDLPWRIATGKLTLSGFEIRRADEATPSQVAAAGDDLTQPLFQLRQGGLVLEACRIQHNDACVVMDAGSQVRVVNTLLATLGSAATIRARFDGDTSLSVSDSLVIGQQMILLDRLDGVGGQLSLRDSTWYGEQLIEVENEAAWPPRPVPLRVEARGNIFQVRFLLAACRSDLGNIAKREIHAQSQLQKLLRWRGDYNLFSIRDSYHGFQLPRKGVIAGRGGFLDLASWKEFCSAEGEGSAEAATSVLRSDLNPAQRATGNIDLLQFELARDASAGKFGANVRTLGPAALLDL